MRRPRPLIIAAFFGAIASLAASYFAVSTGSAWLAVLAILLVGGASLMPDLLAYRQTRKTLAEARRPAARPEAIARSEPEQPIRLPESFSQAIH